MNFVSVTAVLPEFRIGQSRGRCVCSCSSLSSLAAESLVVALVESKEAATKACGGMRLVKV